MQENRKLLIATSNEGKLKEIKLFLSDLPFEIVSIKDLEENIEPPAEPHDTIEANALLKATYYAEKTGLLSLADDSGLFIESLGGWPGVNTAEARAVENDKFEILLKKLEGKEGAQRKATFKSVLVAYDPVSGNMFSSRGQLEGEIVKEPREVGQTGYGYEPVFVVPNVLKTYSEMSILEKNAVSHRGKALIKMKYILENNYSPRHFVVPCAFIIKDGKLLMNRRNDPHNEEVHSKWEFPGGTMEFGETIEENIIREANEEAGYNVEVVERINYLELIDVERKSGSRYQIYLLPVVCRVSGGDGKYNDAEVMESRWFDLEEVLDYDLLPNNDIFFKNIREELERIIKENNL